MPSTSVRLSGLVHYSQAIFNVHFVSIDGTNRNSTQFLRFNYPLDFTVTQVTCISTTQLFITIISELTTLSECGQFSDQCNSSPAAFCSKDN